MRAFHTYGEPLENVMAFRYLGRVMTAGDDDWPAVIGNLQKARKSWGRLSRILSWEGADPKVSGHFQGGEPCGVVVRGGDVGNDPQDGAGPEYFLTKGSATDHR